MSQQYPQQPQWGQQPQQQQYPQQQPGWGGPQQPGWGAPPPPPKKTSAGKIIGLIVAGFLVVGVIGAVVGGGSDDSSSDVSTAATDNSKVKDVVPDAEKEEPADAKTSDKPKADAPKKETKPTVVFKVWGTAPAGALGPLDITYGSDTDTRKGSFKNGKFEATLSLNEDALYYTVMAQLQGSGDINCSVTVGGETKKAHAAGGYNICNAQLSSDFFGGFN